MEDFRKETIYFIVVDRFFDGDPDNNLGKCDEQFDPTRTNWQMYWGGDLDGIVEKLDYIRGMGASAIWITPVFQQVSEVVIEKGVRRAPYHGYWAKDFKRIDEHLVNRHEDIRVFERNDGMFDRLISELHARGGKLVLDIVCNHSSPHLPGGRGVLYDDGVKLASYDEDNGSWYHRMGDVKNWSDLQEVQNGDLCDLSDFNEESLAYRNYIKGAIKKWLSKGVDGLRVDTVKHMPLWFWQEFVSDMRCHQPDVFMFGEWFLGGVYDPDSLTFMRCSGMSMLDFSLRQAIEDALARDVYRGFAQVGDIFQRDGLLRRATELVTFVDNHDLPRFLSIRNDAARFRMANLLIMTARGIPCIFYGSEQLLHNDTNGGNDPYNRPMMEKWDTDSPLYRELRILADLRRRNVAVQKGGTFLHVVSPDLFVFSRRYQGSSIVVAMNKGAPAAIQVADLPLPAGPHKCLLSGRTVDVKNGLADLKLECNDVLVLENTVPTPSSRAVCEFQLNGITTRYGEEVFLVGDCPELGGWDYEHPIRMEYVNSNTWCVDVPYEATCGREFAYKFFLRTPSGIQREMAMPRIRVAPKEGCARFRDDWSTHFPD
ncbi:MAG: cyclomaltodextrin glucanotransferase [Deltaproteobacteria bacterium]|nr:cyclomaltodextrin glucanotransferase [Deltaproteobacteria bacterium]